MNADDMKKAMDAVGRELFILALVGMDITLFLTGHDGPAEAVLAILAGSAATYFFSQSPG